MCDNKVMYSIVKRVFDIIFAVLVLVLTSPLMLIFIAAIKLESKGSAIYKQVRVGQFGREFNLYKLRSMYVNAEKEGPKMADKNDRRITGVGRIIRKRRIDELPQMINVLKGDMSLIGPRPERPYFTCIFCEKLPEFRSRLQVKSGITGWAQVNGGYDLTPEKKLSYDLYYIKNRSIYLDLIIIIKTVMVILRGENEN
ncbi:MAG: exopolysaccharide biosynthesis polyprenyl glycosylphosphotransferase [Bacillota bacterium]|nr:exopolysaccharide biosynthesis polyprenyl glycosylphosphotransferase [Bacillota bacterium]